MGLFPFCLRGKTDAAGRSYNTTVSSTALIFRNKKKAIETIAHNSHLNKFYLGLPFFVK
jgi:hypothetical protein